MTCIDSAAVDSDPPWLHDLSERAVHLYGPPTEQDSLRYDEHAPYQLYPSMNFTCPGTILKLFFVANRTQNGGFLMSPEFYLQREYCHSSVSSCEYQWLTLNQTTQHPLRLLRSIDNEVGLYEIVLLSNNTFNSGDILGVCHPRPDGNNSVLSILYQNGGGYSHTLECSSTSGYIWVYNFTRTNTSLHCN